MNNTMMMMWKELEGCSNSFGPEPMMFAFASFLFLPVEALTHLNSNLTCALNDHESWSTESSRVAGASRRLSIVLHTAPLR